MPTIKGIYVPADCQQEISVVEFDQSDCQEIEKYTSGPFAALDLFRPYASIFFSDFGKINDLPLNRRGTLILWTHRTEFRGYDALQGDCLILGSADEEGNTLSVPDELVELLFNTKEFRYLVKTQGSDSWNGNGLTFDNWVDAYNGALSLAQRWRLVEHCKVVPA